MKNTIPARSFTHFVAGVLLICLLASVNAAESPMGATDARHFLNRVAFGATPEEIAAFSRLSRTEAIAKVLDSAPAVSKVAISPEVVEFVSRSEKREQRAQGEEARKAFQREQVRHGLMLRAWWVETMLRAPEPADALRERMVLFWHNHFVSSMTKVRSPALLYSQNQLFRTYALGSFSDLLHAASKDPAMVLYLDSATNRKGSPNENFAREVMELFTLGVGNYTEQDIREAARAFTGWSVDPETGQFRQRPALHDDGEKIVFGRRGQFDGDDLLDILLQQPQTAEFIVAKLWKEFVSPTPDMGEVKRIARLWRENGRGGQAKAPRYDTRFVLKQLLSDKAFWAPENRGGIVKSPVDLVIGALHTYGLNSVDGLPFVIVLRQLGQDLFAPPNVKGWPGGDAWINTNTLLVRKQFVERLLRSEDMDSQHMEKGSAMADDMDKRQLRMALNAVHIDADGWARRVQALHLTPEQVLLGVPIEGDGKADSHPREYLRQLMLDTTYQVR